MAITINIKPIFVLKH